MPFLQMRDAAQIYYVDEGQGRPIILSHGWKASSDAYEKTCELLTASFRCIRYDQRGHMRSSVPARMPVMADLADDLNEIVRKLCPQKPVLVGWSMGGATVLEFVRRYGCEEVAALMLVDVSPKLLNDGTWQCGRDGGRYTKETLAQDMEWMKRDFTGFLNRYYSATVPGYESLPEQQKQARIQSKIKGHCPQVLASLWESLCTADYRDVLPRINLPTAIVHAGIRPACSTEAAQYYADRIAGTVKKIHFANASHALIVEQPERFAKEVKTFIDEIERSQT